jgi:nitroreductase
VSSILSESNGASVLEAIRTRRSIGKVQAERPPRELVERILEAATYAPNHHLTEPWRFVVIAGDARAQLGEAMARTKSVGLDLNDPTVAADFEKTKQRAFRSPVVIAVVAHIAEHMKGGEVEEISAVSAAVQNLLLAAHALGLGAMWRTGDFAFETSVKEFLGFTGDDHIVGFVYLGYPAMEREPAKRKPISELTTWLGWDD